ncbi:hypothetical protein SAMN05421823_10276 [Catalinimonas alkaloidigena]|uniref:Tetratricopeptide repeat-containing protein n=1 Tax=Catalinimonas alkaloidigena TaxID=1075417 RepID=A0A1G8ZSL3_9BACT|nr:hypothetical protein [Catalinimonas alkaloidigena]SDK18038.1 hypothetical protein SAMN05421823_10276 [Catalinimonas alkaloidigena]
MRIFGWGLLLVTLWLGDGGLSRIAKLNRAREEAAEAYQAHQWEQAIQKYTYLVDSLRDETPAATLNLANAYFQADQKEDAQRYYLRLTSTDDAKVRSVARQQLGVLAHEQDNVELALGHLKESLKADPTNEAARYNYELLKRLQAQQQEEEKNKQEEQKQQDEQKQQEPSDYAKAMKAQAEQLAAQHRYQAAYQLMQEALRKDKTTEAFNDFIKRLGEVADINNLN